MEARVNGRASAESARIDGAINALGAEHRAQLCAVLEATMNLGLGIDLKLEAMEERRVSDLKAMLDNYPLEIKIVKERFGAR